MPDAPPPAAPRSRRGPPPPVRPAELRDHLRRKLRLRLLFLALGVSAALLTVLGLGTARLREETCRTAIGKAGLQTAEQVQTFLWPVTRLLTVSRAWIQSGLLKEPGQADAVARAFAPLLEPTPQVVGMLMAWTNGTDITVLRDEQDWIARRSTPGPDGLAQQHWTRLGAGLETLEQGERTIAWDARSRPWFQGALDLSPTNGVFWTEPYEFFTLKRRGVTLSAPCRLPGRSDPDLVLGFDILLDPLADLFRDLEYVQGGRVLLVGRDERILELAGLESGKGAAPDPLLTAALAAWARAGSRSDRPFRFLHEGRRWWGNLRPRELGDQRIHAGIVIPEDRLLGEGFRLAPVLLILAIAVVGMLSGALAVRRYGRGMQEAEALTGPGEDEMEALIARGETASLEFKSSLRWDYREEKTNKKLEEVILKSIAAFNNSEGGTLLIGVSDAGEILGLEPDYQSLKEHGKDYFELHLRNLVTQAYGLDYATRGLHVQFPVVGGREICSLHILRGTEPLYVQFTARQGGKQERFFVRSGNASRDLKNPSEIMAYIRRRFA